MKIKWNGENDTLVRLNPAEEKIEVKSGEQFEVSDQKGRELLKYSKDFQVVAGVVSGDRIDKGYVDLKKRILDCETIEDFEGLKDDLAKEKESEKQDSKGKSKKDGVSKKDKKENDDKVKKESDSEKQDPKEA